MTLVKLERHLHLKGPRTKVTNSARFFLFIAMSLVKHPLDGELCLILCVKKALQGHNSSDLTQLNATATFRFTIQILHSWVHIPKSVNNILKLLKVKHIY